MFFTRRLSASFLGIFSIGLAVLAYQLSWRAGCLFDGKSGIGNMEASIPYSNWSFVSAIGALVLAAVAFSFVKSWRWQNLALSFSLTAVLGGFVMFTVLFTGALNGTEFCKP